MIKRHALEIVHALQKEDYYCWSRYEQLIEDTKTILNRCQLWYVRHIKKKANKACSSLFSDGGNSTSLEASLDMERIILHVFIQKYCTFFFWHIYTRWGGRIRTSNLRFIRCDPQPIELPHRTKNIVLNC